MEQLEEVEVFLEGGLEPIEDGGLDRGNDGGLDVGNDVSNWWEDNLDEVPSC